MIAVPAYAKINLALDVTGRREDGYHEVRMIMTQIGLHDMLYMERIRTSDEVTLTCDRAGLSVGEDNLIVKAARLMQKTYRLRGGVQIHLVKRIPMAAGLAGGSSDAAATMLGMARLFHLSASKEELAALGVQIGADVPFCILGGTCLAEGIGEKLTPIRSFGTHELIIHKTPVGVSTPHAYKRLDERTIDKHPQVDAMIQAIELQQTKQVIALEGNVLELATIPEHPIIDKIKESMTEERVIGVMMSGSGPTVFGFPTDSKAFERVKERLAKLDPEGVTIRTSTLEIPQPIRRVWRKKRCRILP